MIVLPVLLVPGVPWLHRALLAGALLAPIPTALVVGLVVTRLYRRQERPVVGQEASALLAVVAALQAGRTLRVALAGLSPELDRLIAVGAATDAIAEAVERSLPEQGAMAAAAVRLLDLAGGAASPVMEELVAQAAETSRVRRELRAAVAAPVLQGVIVGGAPLAALVIMIVGGGFAETFATSAAHAVTVSVGAVVTVVGVCWVVAIVRRSMP
jgi:Flp pilus assembly protein TadB